MTIKNPYKGLFPYTLKDESLFFGRDKETDDLVEMIRNNQLVVLYGESGTGKTSLINAKLFPELKRQYYFPIYIRLNYGSGEDPMIQLREIINRELTKWDKDIPPFTLDCTLLEYASKTRVLNGLVKPILFFDQFEELFTIGQRNIDLKVLDNMIKQIGDITETRISKLKAEKNETITHEKILTENILNFTVVFSLRQDFVGQLEDLRVQIPSISVNRFRLKKFNETQAFDAITGPAAEYKKTAGIRNNPAEIIDEPTAQKVIKQLKGLAISNISSAAQPPLSVVGVIRKKFGNILPLLNNAAKEKNILRAVSYRNVEIDPTVLSLYCFQLYEEAFTIYNETSVSDVAVITLEQVAESSCEKIIKNYYKLALTRKKYRIAIEKLLITPDGRRILMSLSDFLSKSRLEEAEIERLRVETAIVRIYGEDTNREIELAHDQIARRALISKKAREANKIIRNSFVTLLAVVIIIVLLFSFSTARIRYLRNQVDIVHLHMIINELDSNLNIKRLRNNRLLDSLDVTNRELLSVLANKNTLVTDKVEINKQIRLIKDQLTNELKQNGLLMAEGQQLKEMNNRMEDSLISLRGNISTKTDENARFLDIIAVQKSEMANLLSRVNSTRDSLNILSRRDSTQDRQLLEIKDQLSQLQNLNSDLSTRERACKLQVDSLVAFKVQVQQQQQNH